MIKNVITRNNKLNMNEMTSVQTTVGACFDWLSLQRHLRFQINNFFVIYLLNKSFLSLLIGPVLALMHHVHHSMIVPSSHTDQFN